MTRKEKYAKLRLAGFNSYEATKYKDRADIDLVIKEFILNVGDSVHIIPADNRIGIVLSRNKNNTYDVKFNAGLDSLIFTFNRNELKRVNNE